MARPLTSTTFKPYLDQSLAMDGEGVVLTSDGESALLLRFADGDWVASRHEACAGTGSPADIESLRWRGVRYARDGFVARRFSATTSRREWDEFYAEMLGVSASWPMLPPRRGQRDVDVFAPAM